jgi:hypothetical protein
VIHPYQRLRQCRPLYRRALLGLDGLRLGQSLVLLQVLQSQHLPDAVLRLLVLVLHLVLARRCHLVLVPQLGEVLPGVECDPCPDLEQKDYCQALPLGAVYPCPDWKKTDCFQLSVLGLAGSMALQPLEQRGFLLPGRKVAVASVSQKLQAPLKLLAWPV